MVVPQPLGGKGLECQSGESTSKGDLCKGNGEIFQDFTKSRRTLSVKQFEEGAPQAHKQCWDGSKKIFYRKRCQFQDFRKRKANQELDKEIQSIKRDDDAGTHVKCTKNGHCDKSRGIIGAQGTCSKVGLLSSLKQSSAVQPTAQNDDWLAFCGGGGGGENNIAMIMESGIPSPSLTYRGFATVNKGNVEMCKASQQRLCPSNDSTVAFTISEMNSKALRCINRNTKYSGRTISNRNKYKVLKRSGSNNNITIISSSVTVSNLCRPLFNFFLLTTFLLSCFNCCDQVQGEPLLSSTQPTLQRNNNLFKSRNNIDNGETITLPLNLYGTTYDAPAPSKNLSQRNFNGDSVGEVANIRVDNNSHVSHGKVVNEKGKSTSKKASSFSTAAGADLRELLSQPLESIDKNILLKVTVSMYYFYSLGNNLLV